MTVKMVWRPYTRRETYQRAYDRLPGGPSLFQPGAKDTRTQAEKDAARRVHRAKMRHDREYREWQMICVDVGHARVDYDPEVDDEPTHELPTVAPVVVRPRARQHSARRTRSAATKKAASGDGDGEPPPALRPFVDALADLILADLKKRRTA